MSNQSFYNTVSFSGEELKNANARAAALEDLIAALFKANPGKKYSPYQIHTIIYKRYQRNTLLTSVRRGMTNLCKDSYGKILTKTDEMIPGQYGVREHLWELTPENLYGPEKQSAGDIASTMINDRRNGQGRLF